MRPTPFVLAAVVATAALAWIPLGLGTAPGAPAPEQAPDGQPGASGGLFVHVERGHIGCSQGGPGAVSTTDLCGKLGLDDNAKATFTIPVGHIERRVTSAYYEVSWVPTSALGAEELSLTFFPGVSRAMETEASGDVFRTRDPEQAPFLVRGGSPLWIRMETPRADPLYWFHEQSYLLVEVRSPGAWQPSPVLGGAGLVLGQDFVVCVVLATEGRPLPDPLPCSPA